VEPAELEKIAGTPHHGGVVAVVTPPQMREPGAEELRAWAKQREGVLVLDRVGNVHNLGAIARTAAFFGVGRLVICGREGAARPVDAAYRVAEGGLEGVELHASADAIALVRALVAAGYEVVGAATRGGRPELSRSSARPLALVLGNEEHGLDPAVAAACSRLVTLPGAGRVESLNVSVCAGILLHALRNQWLAKRPDVAITASEQQLLVEHWLARSCQNARQIIERENSRLVPWFEFVRGGRFYQPF
ncbi:RNA methyltransferase, partial [bacterium]|nr:RNA methyltransferase [bacterium]